MAKKHEDAQPLPSPSVEMKEGQAHEAEAEPKPEAPTAAKPPAVASPPAEAAPVAETTPKAEAAVEAPVAKSPVDESAPKPEAEPKPEAPPTKEVPAAKPRPAKKHPDLLILLHGIRDMASWVYTVKESLQDGSLEVVSIPYGYFNAFQFLDPFFSRKRVVRYVEKQLRNLIANHRVKHPTAKVSILAHSFGCYVVSQMLTRDPFLKLDKLVFCGSVLNRTFPSDILLRQVTTFVNDCGTKDVWPLIAGSVTWGYGDTGTFGFGINAIDRFHNFGHGGFFGSAFIEKYWKSLFHDGLTEKGELPQGLRGFQRIPLVIPFRWLLVAGFLALFWWVLLPCLLWIFSVLGVEFSFLTIRHNYRLPTVPVNTHLARENGLGLRPPNSTGVAVDSEVVRSMYKWKEWVLEGTKPPVGNQTKGVVVVWSDNPFPESYSTFTATVTINPAWQIVEGCAFLTQERNEAGQYRPVYRQLDFNIPVGGSPVDNTLEITKPNKGDKLLLILRVEGVTSPLGPAARIPDDPSTLNIGVTRR
jgi:hypothetical protein